MTSFVGDSGRGRHFLHAKNVIMMEAFGNISRWYVDWSCIGGVGRRSIFGEIGVALLGVYSVAVESIRSESMCWSLSWKGKGRLLFLLVCSNRESISLGVRVDISFVVSVFVFGTEGRGWRLVEALDMCWRRFFLKVQKPELVLEGFV